MLAQFQPKINVVDHVKTIQFFDDFESGNLSKWNMEVAAADRVMIVNDPMNILNNVVKITIHPEDIAAQKNRAEIKFANHNLNNEFFSEGKESWISWKILIPEDYIESSSEKFQIMGQFHTYPPYGEGFDWFQNTFGKSVAPPLAFYYGSDGSRQGLQLIWNQGLPGSNKKFDELELEKGVWHQIEVHAKWSKSDSGFIEVKVNGKEYVSKTVGQTVKTNQGNFLKLGIYRQDGIDSVNSVYYDDVKIEI